MNQFYETTLKQQSFFKEGNTIPIPFRLGALASLEGQLIENEAAICNALFNDFSQCPTETYITEIGPLIKEIHLIQKKLRKYTRPTKNLTSTKFFLKTQITSFPYGISLLFSSWKNPVYSALLPLIDTIAAGNTAILGTNPRTPHTALVLSKILNQCFEPEFVTTFSQNEISEEDFSTIHHFSFWGEKEKLKEFLPVCQKYEIPIASFCGGQNLCVISKTASIEEAAKHVFCGKFRNAGQNFFSPDCVIIENSMKKLFVDILAEEILESYGENPLESFDLSSIVDIHHFNKLKNTLEKCSHIELGGQSNLSSQKITPSICFIENFSQLPKGPIDGPILFLLGSDDLDQSLSDISLLPRFPFFYGFSSKKSPLFGISSFPNASIICKNQCFSIPPSGLPLGTQAIGGRFSGVSGFTSFSKEITLVEARSQKSQYFLFPPFGNGDFQKVKKVFK